MPRGHPDRDPGLRFSGRLRYHPWTGLHSYAEEGTGERVVDEVVAMLDELAKK
jgi:hypothetical protein